MESELHPAAENQLDRLRTLADKLDCLLETDLMLLAGITASTAEAWRKRGTGPAYLMLGNRPLYPRKLAAKFIESRVREPRQIDVKAVL
jgi:hypothetical protein